MTTPKTEEEPALSPSIANYMRECAREGWLRHRLLGNQPKPPTRVTDLGRLYESMLGVGEHPLHIIEADSYRSKAAQAERDDAYEAGKLPVLADKHREAEEVTEHLRRSLDAKKLLQTPGVVQEKFEWREKTESGPLLIHAVPDWIREDGQLIVDLKVTEGSVKPEVCTTKLLQLGGVIQHVAYVRGLEVRNPDLAGRIDMVFVFVQIKPPYLVTPIRCGATMREIGEVWWENAKETFARCLKKGRGVENWPDHGNQPVTVEAPGWLVQRVLYEGEDY